MPVVAVAAAVVLDAGAIGAIAAGTLTTLAAVTAIGATIGAIGAVTHNKTLSLIGMGMGIVGAVGTLASGAGVFDNVSDLFGSSTAADSANLSKFAGTGMDAATQAVNEGTSGLINSASSDILSQAGNLDMAALTPTGVPTTAGLESSVSVTPTGFPKEIADATMTPDAAMAEGLKDAAGPLSDPSAAMTPTIDPFAPGAPAASITDASNGVNSYFTNKFIDANGTGGIFNWAKNNQLLAYGMLQAGGSFLSGLTNPLSPAQVDALNAQAEANRASAALLQRQANNIAGPIPTFTPPAPVTGAPERQNGLINNSPVNAPLVTGVPNTGAQPRTGALV